MGLATARALVSGGFSVAVLEAEDRVARHQTGHNSGVIHSGLYYQPGSLKAKTCMAGRTALYDFCREHGIRHERCGKVDLATTRDELPALRELERRGRGNGLEGLVRLEAGQIASHEPHAVGAGGLLVPDTGIVDFSSVAAAFVDEVARAGGEILTSSRVSLVRPEGRDLVVETRQSTVRCSHLVNCAGLQSDRVARLCGVEPGVRILPFRGDYYEVRKACVGLEIEFRALGHT